MALCGYVIHVYRKRAQKRETARKNERFRQYSERDNGGRITYPSTYAEGSRRLRERIPAFELRSFGEDRNIGEGSRDVGEGRDVGDGRSSKDGRSLRRVVSQLGEPVPAFELHDFAEGFSPPREEVPTASQLNECGEEDRPERDAVLVVRTRYYPMEQPALTEAMTAFELSDLAENGWLRSSSVRSLSPVRTPRSIVTGDDPDSHGSTDIDVDRRGIAWWRHFDS